MKRWFYWLFMCTLFAGVLGVSAQDGNNLLTNPGFEGEYVEQGGTPVRLVAPGWTAWDTPHADTDPAWQNRQPVYEPVAPNVDRIRSGDNAQLFYNNTFWGHNAGLFQQVSGITPGTELRFSVYARVWSSSFDDQEVSEQPGDATIEVGIDPNGGTDPTSPNIVWSFAIEQYDDYRQYSTIASAANSTVTVWIRSNVGFAVQNTYVYLDDAVLEITPENPVTVESPTVLVPSDTPTIPVVSDTPTATATSTEIVATLEPSFTPTVTLTLAPSNTVDPDLATPTIEGPTFTPTATVPTATPTGMTLVPTVPSNTPTVTATQPTNTPRPTGVGPEFLNTILYTVRRGDTVGRIAVVYGSTVDAINGANTLNEDNLIFVGQQLIVPVPLAPPMTATPSPSPIPSNTPEIVVTPTTASTVQAVYVVQRGDTLSTIAARFNTTVTALAQQNNILNVNRIFAGQSLAIPGTTPAPATAVPQQPSAPQTYVIQRGDTLSRISVRFGVSIPQLIEANNITNPNLIYAGQTLRIP